MLVLRQFFLNIRRCLIPWLIAFWWVNNDLGKQGLLSGTNGSGFLCYVETLPEGYRVFLEHAGRSSRSLTTAFMLMLLVEVNASSVMNC
jgi:hypothetical protein